MPAAEKQRPSILIIDHEEPIRRLLSTLLEGYHCVAAATNHQLKRPSLSQPEKARLSHWRGLHY
jgi:CheY-like chemotaxis protein